MACIQHAAALSCSRLPCVGCYGSLYLHALAAALPVPCSGILKVEFDAPSWILGIRLLSLVAVYCRSLSSHEQVPSMMASPTTVAASTNLAGQSDSLAISYLIRAYQVQNGQGGVESVAQAGLNDC